MVCLSLVPHGLGEASDTFWAQVTFVRGTVSCVPQGSETSQDLRRGEVLHSGDTVRAGEGSQASLLLSDGSIVVVRPGKELVLGPAERASRPSLQVVAGNLSRTLLSREGDNPMLKHLGGLRASDSNIALAPCRTKVRAPVRMVWLPWPGVSRYSVTVMGPQDVVFEGVCEGTSLDLPDAALDADTTYYWEVRDAVSDDTYTALGSGSFATLPLEVAESVRALEKALDAAFSEGDPETDSTPLFLAYQIYLENGLNLRALEILERLRARDPGDPALERWRQALCAEMGLEPDHVGQLFAAPADS
jgi:hypothetical protein